MSKESGGLTSVGTEVPDASTSGADYSRDEFDVDVVPGQRRGAHRVASPPLVAALPWIFIGLFLLACVVVLATMYGGLGAQRAAAPTATTSPSATASPTAAATEAAAGPEIDKGVQLLVLNGTRTSSLTDKASRRLRDDGWIVANSGSNSDRQVATTFVVYKDESLKDTAQALVDFLGGGGIQHDPALPEDMRVVLGKNYSR